MNKDSLRIALIQHDTRNANLGVGALAMSEIELLNAASKKIKKKLNLINLVGRTTSKSILGEKDVQEIEVRPLKNPIGFFKILRTTDIVIDISGGDSFTDLYGNYRIAQLLFMKFLVLLANRPLVLAPQTIGPFKNRFWRTLAMATLKRSSLIVTRDRMSTNYLAKYGLSDGVIEASDVALRLRYKKIVPSSGSIRVGLNVSGLLAGGGYSGSNMFGLTLDYYKLMVDVAEFFVNHCERCELHLVGHVYSDPPGQIEDDLKICSELKKLFPSAVLAPRFETPSDAKSYIASMDFFLGSRMHACIAAFSTNVAVVPLAYSRKFAGLFGSLNYNETIDLTAEDPTLILDKIKKAFARRLEIKQEMEKSLQVGLKKLEHYDAGLQDILIEASDR